METVGVLNDDGSLNDEVLMIRRKMRTDFIIFLLINHVSWT